jgi:hypothetical protein
MRPVNVTGTGTGALLVIGRSPRFSRLGHNPLVRYRQQAGGFPEIALI